MLTAFLVNSLDDTILDDGLTTLREALMAADTNTELWEGAVPAGSATEIDAIEFDPALFTDGTSPVPGFQRYQEDFVHRMAARGMRTTTCKDYLA